ncbi:hypothetical protein AM501_28900 [Aneurinibacillus migulanus]|uniref:Uncharacterized protein n=1 Tax=Aneurinibacillus migulanus TaxID=47500 RepID=A0A0D1VVA8_ANEMI|nr:hypothetical protein [Aneurinibacillus migulanus]KIV50175.1 hypothetical protein TS65_30590 [Aneurinibacillus migulanus]KIV52623.1 hypothetical protein TS64_21605 [Aneurinibacillus migulanus]KON96209.1 hypothetical protein AF333_12675 [Aneurinibacillus migulanus]KPD04918.1 hypothetical protein AM501_28900 [Aneurinibacillus migulanus]MCP1357315.1 hypothetical protein [Aneurinibacillus migulanus]
MEKMWEAFEHMQGNWSRMQHSDDQEEAEEDANRFEESFYAFIEAFRIWFNTLKPRPATLDEALVLPEVEKITEELPVPLYLNFETELEYIIEDKTRIEDEKYD